MISKPLISVVITYFKKKKFIKKTLDSIFNQSYQNFELVFVFDDEDKKDLNFIKSLLKKFKRKKLIINKKNLGVANSRNLAIKHCKGDYLAFIDADDIWLKNKLNIQLNLMLKKGYQLSYSAYSIINSNGKIISTRV